MSSPRRCTTRPIAALLVLLTCTLPPTAPALDLAGLAALLERLDVEAIGGAGQWRAVVGGRAVMVLADPSHGRLRIQAHVTAADALDEALLRRVLEADFATALEARYAIGGTTLWSLYSADLAALDAAGCAAALGQVANLAASFGREYASGLGPDGRPDASPRGALVTDLVARAAAATPEQTP
ncbi:MAG: hypothetical protein H6977_02725 [Gammaproteobacteria bacterium]|nr:hypothetical protein [Gammaproteobacteria bacterium]MCP5198899.1 hypothetical protein [Gammaproteobacteria bacterium]